MSTRPPLHALSPRAATASTTDSPHYGFPPSAIPTAAASPLRPKRPLSASRVPTTVAANAAYRPRSAGASSPRRRPASASRVRTVDAAFDDDDVDTIPFPTRRIPDATDGAEPDPQPQNTPQFLQPHRDDSPSPELDRTSLANAEQFLLAWQREEQTFRSPLLFAESAFAQATAMTATEWPHPNPFLSAVAFGALELVLQSLVRHHPFLLDVLDALGLALFTNYRDLRRLEPMGHSKLFQYMHHGRFCFQELHAHKEQLNTLRGAAHKAKLEAKRLGEQLQKQQVARLFERVQARVKNAAETVVPPSLDSAEPTGSYPHLRRVLYGDGRGAHLDLSAHAYEFEPTCDEILLFFNSLPPGEAQKLVALLLTKAAECQLPGLGGTYATAVDMLCEKERRAFLTEYFQLVATDELQDALRQRDETSNEKQWQTFLDEMKDVLHVRDWNHATHAPRRDQSDQSFHSDEARVGSAVYELVDLVEEVAAEASLSDEKTPLQLSPEVLERLRPYQNAKKKVEKARRMMMSMPETACVTVDVECGCVCGKHRLVALDEPHSTQPERPSNDSTSKDESCPPNGRLTHDQLVSSKRKKSIGRRRPTSAKSSTKSSGYNVSARVSTRSSLAGLRVFPLSEVCHIISLVVQLQFARDTPAGSSSRRFSARHSSREQELTDALQRPSFKILAKDLLTRKYGIKSIAVMHMLQLEKSLVFYAANEKHCRCELFAWFIGADKTRSSYKDLAYQFYITLVKAIIAVFLRKSVESLTYADLIGVWSEQIGEADPAAPAVVPRTLSPAQCIEVSTLAFPGALKDASPSYSATVDRFRTCGESVDLEEFMARALGLWEGMVVKVMAQVEEAASRVVPVHVDGLDLPLFRECLLVCALELTSGEALEHFDRLTPDDDVLVPVARMVQFVTEMKYLR